MTTDWVTKDSRWWAVLHFFVAGVFYYFGLSELIRIIRRESWGRGFQSGHLVGRDTVIDEVTGDA